MNYLALLGWSPGDDTGEILSRDELASAFELERVTHAAAVFDQKKLDWVNGEWMRRLDTADLAVAYRARRAVALRRPASTPRCSATRCAIGQERSSTLVQLLDQMDFLFVADDDFAIEPDAWARLESIDRVARRARRDDRARRDVRVDRRRRSTSWSRSRRSALKPGKVMAAVYVAVEGRAQGLPVFDGIWLLGRSARSHGSRRLPARLTRPSSGRSGDDQLPEPSPFGGGVIGNTAGSGPAFGGSSPPPRARDRELRRAPGSSSRQHISGPAPSSSGLGRRPLKAVTAVRICSGLQREPGPRGRALRVHDARPARTRRHRARSRACRGATCGSRA